MKSITRSLALSLGLAASAVFLISIAIVVCLNIFFDSTSESCQAATAVLERAVIFDKSQRLQLLPTTDLVNFQSLNQDLWYVVSQNDQTVEYGREHRPSFLRLSSNASDTGVPPVDLTGKEGIRCLKMIPKGASELILMSNSGFNATGEITEALAEGFLKRNVYSILWVGFGFAVVVLAGILFSARFVSNSIKRVTKFAMEIDPAAPGVPASLEEVPVELKPLVTALINALDEIDAYVQAQRRFLSNAAHQLRTPLTMLRVKLDDVREPTLRAELIADLHRLTSLVSAMLDLARLQNHAIEKKPFDLVALARDVLVDFGPSALDTGIELVLESGESPTALVCGAETAIRSALSNLLSNVLIHAKEVRRIVVNVSSAGVSVSDNGEGLPAGFQTTILESFQTGGPGNKGTGIGLSIVREIMAAHEGTLHIASRPGKGTTVSLCFPNDKCSTSVGQEPSLSYAGVGLASPALAL
jgi:signal transduction histidine kinase